MFPTCPARHSDVVREEGLFVLRIWRDSQGNDAWRASLRDLRSGETALLESLEALTHFLAHHTEHAQEGAHEGQRERRDTREPEV